MTVSRLKLRVVGVRVAKYMTDQLEIPFKKHII